MCALTEDLDVRISTPCRISRPISLLLALSACAAAGAAPATRTAASPEPAAAAPTASPTRAVPAPAAAGSLDRALDSVLAPKIRSDEFFIASDELGGRDTPSLGQRVAARYIRARLERLGWKPGAKDGGYFFPYQLDPKKIDEQGSTLVWNSGKAPAAEGELRFGDDYFFTSTFDSKDLTASGGVVFCGDASKADLEKCGVSGKWALVVDDGTELRKMRAPGKRAGAVGVLLAAAAGSEPYEKRYAKDLENLRRGHLAPKRAPAKGDEDSDKSDPVYPVLLLERPALARLFSAAGVLAEGPAVGTDLGLVLTETRKLAPLVQVEDVCGYWPGSDPVLAKETIIVSAHYDHVGTKNGVVYNGADDNGSGTCGLMAIAEALANYGPMRRSVMLIWVSGEEKGLWGSAAWTKDPWVPDGGKPICDINIDMIGRNAPDKLLITPTRELPQYNGLVRIAEKVGPLEGFPKLGSCDEYWRRSDHMNFSDNLKIPVCFLFSDVHEDYHQPTDKPEKIDNDKIRRVSRMVLRMLEELQADRLEL
jgi:hypothetical protein